MPESARKLINVWALPSGTRWNAGESNAPDASALALWLPEGRDVYAIALQVRVRVRVRVRV